MFRSVLTDRLQAAFTSAGIALPEGFKVTVELASDTRFGDYQSNAAMILAKQLKTNPRALAEQIKAAFSAEDLCSDVSIAGPGFLNFRISPAALSTKIQAVVQGAQCDVIQVTQPQTIVVDFSAPNIAKPMHVGHIRSTFIGDCLARVARFVGHKVITDNHVGDWGTQFGMIIHGWKTELDHKALKKDPIHELVRTYKLINAKTKEDESVLVLCKGELVKLQQGDEENLGIWKECVRLTLEQLEKVYGTLDIQFDHYLGESFYNDALAPLVEDLLARDIATISEGATVIFSDGQCDPKDDPFLVKEGDGWKPTPAIIRKSDGGFLYATTDLATIDYRVKEWKADEIWYVVGAPQQLHFRQVFATAHRMGHTTAMTHIAFGSILGPDGKMFKTRSGETVGLLEVIDEAIERARAAADEKDQGLTDSEKDEIAHIIGSGAVKYAELSQNRLTDYKFSWDKMLSLQGNTAPYLINAYVRTRSIFRKLEGSDVTLTADVVLTEPAEIALAVKLAQFAEATHDVLVDHRPNTLATYLYELANTYHSFYEACHVLNSQGTVRNTRLTLCEATSRVLKTGLGLLGIQTTERM
ncbi:arginyl-tRNA synthetase [Prosthecobacter debontii]|uniref:Arginine--tRNA ligase n=1 Tax=Prosthecobacter debontii TaxID=48467 RepID=A0A1T4WG48_9BACT|nr:arginine--tRNA ligase [Prosthecobacter debontii]SKA76304.1 arginyl-tRNA synthetase [Prosthecobacter debontii]